MTNNLFLSYFGFDLLQFVRLFDFFTELYISENIAWWGTHPIAKEKQHLATSCYGTEVVKDTFLELFTVRGMTL